MGVSSATRMVGTTVASVAGGVTGTRSRDEPLDGFELESIRESGDAASDPGLPGVPPDQFSSDRVEARDASDRGRRAKPVGNSAESGVRGGPVRRLAGSGGARP